MILNEKGLVPFPPCFEGRHTFDVLVNQFAFGLGVVGKIVDGI